MKLVLAIIQSDDVRKVTEALAHKGYAATRLASTGGFLQRGSATLVIGIDDGAVDEVIEIVGHSSATRTQEVVPVALIGEPGEFALQLPMETESGGAVIFVLSVDRFVKV